MKGTRFDPVHSVALLRPPGTISATADPCWGFPCTLFNCIIGHKPFCRCCRRPAPSRVSARYGAVRGSHPRRTVSPALFRGTRHQTSRHPILSV